MTSMNPIVAFETHVQGDDLLEDSLNSSVRDYFENHFSNSFKDLSASSSCIISSYNLKIGDVLEINPSKGAIRTHEKLSLDLSKHYGKSFKIVDIVVQYLPEVLRHGENGPPTVTIKSANEAV